MRLDLIRQRPWWAAAVLGAVCGLALGLLVPPVKPAPAADAPEPAWSLPRPADTVRRDDNALAMVRGAALWRGGAVGTAAVAKWKLVGVIGEGDKRTALVLVEGRPDLLRVGNGDALPDDGRVVDVGRFGMRINIYGCENLILRLYTPGQRSPAPDCGYASDNLSGRGRVPGARVPASNAPHRGNRPDQGNRPRQGNRPNHVKPQNRPDGPRNGARNGPRNGSRNGPRNGQSPAGGNRVNRVVPPRVPAPAAAPATP